MTMDKFEEEEDGSMSYRPYDFKTSEHKRRAHIMMFEGTAASDIKRWREIVPEILPGDKETIFISSYLKPLQDISRTMHPKKRLTLLMLLVAYFSRLCLRTTGKPMRTHFARHLMVTRAFDAGADRNELSQLAQAMAHDEEAQQRYYHLKQSKATAHHANGLVASLVEAARVSATRDAPSPYRAAPPSPHHASPSPYRDAPSSFRDAPSPHYASPSRYRDAPSSYRDEPSSYRDAPSSFRDAPSPHYASPSRYRDAALARSPSLHAADVTLWSSPRSTGADKAPTGLAASVIKAALSRTSSSTPAPRLAPAFARQSLPRAIDSGFY